MWRFDDDRNEHWIIHVLSWSYRWLLPFAKVLFSAGLGGFAEALN